MSELKTIRTDVIGSLLRPDFLKGAHEMVDEGQMDSDELRAAEDRAVREAVALQEAAGLDIVTDGEMRRLNFQDSFGASVTGFDAARADMRFYEARVHGAAPLQRWEFPVDEKKATAVSQRRPVVEKLKLAHNLPLDEYRFVKTVARKPAKVTLIGPDRIAQRFDHQRSKAIYPTMDDFMADLVKIERAMIQSLVDAGCRYIQIDAPGYTAYVDQPSLDAMRARGEDPMENFARSIKADNEVIQGFDGVTFGIHICRGNQRSMWHREGTYDPIAEKLLNGLNHDRILLEYDSPRAGTFEALRFVPKGKVVVLGVVSTKVPELEKVDELKRRVDNASRYVPLEQLAVSPQCGFASDVIGNLVTPDDQKRKLELVVETARQLWSK
jgi:5-methyltetrahydropteroyltriglutamate--homocysteine methyltransferase